MAGTRDRVLATHVGSLIRPPELIEYLKKIEAGQAYDERGYEACLKTSIDTVVRQQAEAGIDIVSDGEFSKGKNWAFYIHDRLGGITRRPLTAEEAKDPMASPGGGQDRKAFAEFYAEYDQATGLAGRLGHRVVVSNKLKYTGHAQVARDIANLKAAVGKTKAVGAFLPVVAPASALPGAKFDDVYRDERDFLFGLAEALRDEYRAIVDAGLYVQIDDAFLPYMYEKMVPPMTLADYRKWAEMRIDALNHALEGIPAEKARYHICWGSWNGPHMFDVPMKDIVDLVLKVKVGAYLFEAANPRHEHEWRVWEKVKLAPGKTLIPGVISHATNVVEHPELVAERIVRLAKIVGRENVMGGTDCGFAQSPFARRVHPTIMWAKLKALAEGCKIATAELWGRRSAA
ncbi:MAG TPA: cobalamin-independent methionine synthase II family protein [Alphaproteobacteria bacterium]|jgi:5-methyltetrahydropteroyltriglutamate--homocysteine methyltransferase|nr:cobalamin-independent methionine synthase II family protein [Alphaproteobacteria bacterium]